MGLKALRGFCGGFILVFGSEPSDDINFVYELGLKAKLN